MYDLCFYLVFFPKDEIIYKEGDPIIGIYFLVSGKVGMVLNTELKEHVYMYIEEGHYFGEIDFITNNALDANAFQSSTLDKKRKFTWTTMEICELILWSKKNMYLAENEFGNVIREIFRNAQIRLK